MPALLTVVGGCRTDTRGGRVVGVLTSVVLALVTVAGGCTGDRAGRTVPAASGAAPGPAATGRDGADGTLPDAAVVVVTEHEDRRGTTGGEPPAVVTQIFLRRAGDRIDDFYAVVRDAATGRLVEEDRWSRARPRVFETRDWRACRADAGPPPDPPMTTVGALLSDLLGPRRRPEGARSVAPHVWEIRRGPMRVRVRENGAGWLDRTVTTGTADRLTSTVHDVSARPAAAFPGWQAGWRECIVK